jgi:CDP-diacylglycerol---glycerol-3-phosphate 3-phosphatidyltransferase
MIEGLKPFYNAVLRPALWFFRKLGLKPDHLTVAGVLVFGLAGWFTAEGRWLVASALVVAGAFLDGWDGLLARETGQITRFGGILDSTCDRLTEILWLLGLLVYYVRNPTPGNPGIYLCFAGMSGSMMVSYVKARCEGAGVKCSAGLLQRPERIILLLACMVAGPRVMVWGLLGLTVLTYYTMVERLFVARRNSKGAGPRP